LHQGWNISLFHYRNHGGGALWSDILQGDPLMIDGIVDLGKVLAGVQVPESDYEAFDAYLQKLDYSYVEETDNPVYRRYLRG
jgi:threonine dehydratase